MGVKGFSKAFKPEKIDVRYKDLADKVLAIDAFNEIYRAKAGMANINALTDRNGNPTNHLNVILGVVCQLAKVGAHQIWVFDSPTRKGTVHHNPKKIMETLKRREKKKKIEEEYKKVNKQIEKLTFKATPTFNPKLIKKLQQEEKDEFSEAPPTEKKTTDGKTKTLNSLESLRNRKYQLERQKCELSERTINESKLLLNFLGCTWVEAPETFEAEHMAAQMARDGIVDGVISTDYDTLLFGSPCMYKRYKEKGSSICRFQKWTMSAIGISRKKLIKASVILGVDFAKKTPRIGPKTVLKKMDSVKLTTEQMEASTVFESECPLKDEYDITFPMNDKKKLNDFIDWMVIEKNYSRSRLEKRLSIWLK